MDAPMCIIIIKNNADEKNSKDEPKKLIQVDELGQYAQETGKNCQRHPND